ncbi:hypothetical protein CUA99_18370 [Clostridioides difficile]|nr:hypothetical protein [Clostridioides difficile]
MSAILNSIFIIEKKQVQNCTVLESIFFYKNINPTSETEERKLIRIYKIERYITIEDIEKELALDEKGISLENSIRHRKNKILNSLDDTKILVLLEGFV